CSPVTIIPSTRDATASTARHSPRCRRIATVPGLIVSPHNLSRGNLARSTISTRAPPRASTVAATLPAGPAPQMMASNTVKSPSTQLPTSQSARKAADRHNWRALWSWELGIVELARPPRQIAPSTIALFLDPNPRQLHSAAPVNAWRPEFGMKSMSQAGAISGRLRVGGRYPRASASADVTMPAAPLAPCGWPIIDLVDDPGTRSARAPNSSRTHRDSTASFNTVEVP